MSIDDVLKVTGGSRVYNDSAGNRRGVFYAESWALTHYLMLGSVTRRQEFAEYLSRLQQGVPSADAFHAAFHDDTSVIEKELREYVSRTNFPVLRLATDPAAGKASTARGQRLSDRDARANLGDLLAHIEGRADDARAYLQKLLEEDEHLPRALAALGSIEAREGHAAEGLALLERAGAAAPGDARIQGQLGAALVDKLSHAPGADDFDAIVAEARVVLGRAVALAPGAANSLSNAGYVMMLRDEDLSSARDLLARAVKAAPARDQYRLLLAEVLARQREFDQATAIVGPLVAYASSPVLRDSARRLLGRIADARNRLTSAAGPAAAAADPANPRADTAGARSSLPPAPNPLKDTGSPPASGAAPSFTPILRKMAAGESRVLGHFRAVECAAARVTLVVDTPDGLLRLTAPAFADIDFISYLAEPPGTVNCGPIAGAPRVLVTYRAASGTTGANGDAVAVELLPDGYTPDR
jgi:Flp pilus assembly protein TadD